MLKLITGNHKLGFEGDVGKIYGVQWRNFNGEDQVLNLIKGLKRRSKWKASYNFCLEPSGD